MLFLIQLLMDAWPEVSAPFQLASSHQLESAVAGLVGRRFSRISRLCPGHQDPFGITSSLVYDTAL
jgi:hypothetical protein